MRTPDAELIELRETVPGQWLLAWYAPHVTAGARAGQYVHVRTVEAGGLPVRRPFPIVTADAASGTLTLHAPGAPPSPVSGSSAASMGPRSGREVQWLARLRPGDRVPMVGPLGRPFEVDPRSRHLLLVAEGPAIAALRLLVDEAIRDGRSVVVLFGAPSSAQVYPSSLLPDEVEYVVTTADGTIGHRGSVVDLVLQYEAWADQAFAAGSPALLAALAWLAGGRRERLGVARLGRKRGGGKPVARGSAEARRKAWLQVAVGQAIGCAAGTCLGCMVPGVDGPLRACREGPAFSADELAWEAER